MNGEVEDKNILSPFINLVFEDQDHIEVKMCVTVPMSYANIPSIFHVIKTFKSELDSLVEKVTSYIQNEANNKFYEEIEKKHVSHVADNSRTLCDESADVQLPNIIPIKKKPRIFKMKKEKPKNHRDTNSTKIFMCDKCDYQGTRKSLLKDHMKVHEINEKVPCQICGKLIFEHRRRYLIIIEKYKSFLVVKVLSVGELIPTFLDPSPPYIFNTKH